MLVEKPQRVHELMSHVTSVLAAASQREKLFPAFFADVWLTYVTVNRIREKELFTDNSVSRKNIYILSSRY